MNRNILAISALDPSGCMGLIVDLKTLMAWRMHGMGIPTAILSANTVRVESVYPLSLEAIGTQLETILADIEIHAVKIGMFPNSKTIELVAELLRALNVSNIVLNTVLRTSTGYEIPDDRMIYAYREKLFPLVECVTVNLEEAIAFSGVAVTDVAHMKQAAEAIHQMGPKNVLVTGGHLQGRAMDVLFDGARHHVVDAPRIASTHTRGLGDTFATIISIHLAKKMKVQSAIDPAKKYLARAMVHPFKIGAGNGPLHHNVAI